MADTDRAWFRRHPGANFRIRRAVDGEVEELVRQTVPDGAYQLAIVDGKWLAPDGQEWRIMVIRAASDTMVRLLTMGEQQPETFALYVVGFGARLVLDQTGAE